MGSKHSELTVDNELYHHRLYIVIIPAEDCADNGHEKGDFKGLLASCGPCWDRETRITAF